MRKFEKYVCPKYDTKDLPSELAARSRRKQKAAQKATTPVPTQKVPAPTGPLRRNFNLETYKYHALGDYTTSIRGPLDGYSTQLVSYPIFFCDVLLSVLG